MNHSTIHSYDWYQDLFCRDLGLCVRQSQDWGGGNHDPDKIILIAKYYLANPDFYPIGREMLVESLLESLADKLYACNELHPCEDRVAFVALERAIHNVHDRDAVRPYWDISGTTTPDGIQTWLRTKFADFIFPPSIWSD